MLSERFPSPPARVARSGSLVIFALAAAAVAQAPQRSVAVVPRAEIAAQAAEIDRLLATALTAAQQQPNRIVDDATFVRRAYLQIAGRIPTADEARAFVADRRSDKRAELIDRLLDSPGHLSHEFHFWADLLRARSRLAQRVSGEPFLHWLKEALAADLPYDEMVRQMLTANGPAHQRDNGATGLLLRDLEMPEDSMANTLRVFAGTRLECAQCHNHPFDKWTQRQFFEMAAFSGGMQYRLNPEQSELGRKLRELRTKLVQEHGREAQRALGQILQPATLGIVGTGTGIVRLPNEYRYDDAKPGQPVAAKPAFAPDSSLEVSIPAAAQRGARPAPRGRQNRAPVGPQIGSRAALSDWLTARDNPRFALVIANRFWKRVAGVGLIEPVDDLRDDTVAAIPELMTYLERLVLDLRYDLRQLQRVLLHTQFFQREVAAEADAEAGVAAFVGPALRRMTAEQIWDSLLVLTIPDVDATLRPPGARAEEVYTAFERLTQGSDEQLEALAEEAILRYTKPDEFRAMQRERVAAQQRARAAEQAEKQREARPLLRDLATARRNRDQGEIDRLTAALRRLGVDVPGERRRDPAQVARASDLPSPAPPNHLLHMFGQSDRDQVDGANQEANVPQVLTLLNGIADQRAASDAGSVLSRLLAGAKSADERVRAAFLAMLARQPTGAELASWRSELQARPEQAAADLIWVLLNSHEFRFVR
jgi:hypothetical protein